MARAVEDHWHGPLSGLVVTRYGHAVPCRQIETVADPTTCRDALAIVRRYGIDAPPANEGLSGQLLTEVADESSASRPW